MEFIQCKIVFFEHILWCLSELQELPHWPKELVQQMLVIGKTKGIQKKLTLLRDLQNSVMNIKIPRQKPTILDLPQTVGKDRNQPIEQQGGKDCTIQDI